MIEHFHLQSCLSFEAVSLDLHPGLNVFSGPSGSGKSVLMRAMLASFGLEDPIAALSESTVDWQIDEAQTGLINEQPNVLREVKKEKARYFFNSQSVSRASVRQLSSRHLRHLSVKDYGDFESASVLRLIDGAVMRSDGAFATLLESYRQDYVRFKAIEGELARMRDDELKLREQEEFARFEVSKIEAIDPSPGEYEHLQEMKKNLSKKEKLEAKAAAAQTIFDMEHTVSDILGDLEIDSSFFDDAMNELRTTFDSIQDRFNDLEAMEVESVLDRIEMLAELKRRYGSIESAIEYRDKKRRELEAFTSIDAHLRALQAEYDALKETLRQSAVMLSTKRGAALQALNEAINGYLRLLYLDGGALSLQQDAYGPDGQDVALLSLKRASLQQISAGEFNRLRLALLAVRTESMQGRGGVLMLDEIDANLSGEESMSVARVLRKLSRRFQILVISHQPQLTAMGERHFLVSKKGVSRVEALGSDSLRVDEIARIVSGDAVTQRARHLAEELLETSKHADEGVAV